MRANYVPRCRSRWTQAFAVVHCSTADDDSAARDVRPATLVDLGHLTIHTRALSLPNLNLYQDWDSCEMALQCMPRVRAIYCHTSPPYISYVDLLHMTLSAPGLERLTIDGGSDPRPLYDRTVVRHSVPPHCIPPLRSLRISFQTRLRSAEIDIVPPGTEKCVALAYLLDGVRNTVEDLVLPGELLRLSQFAVADWSSLTALAIYGVCPVLDDTFVRVLSRMPFLRELELVIAQVIGAAPLLIWPCEAHDQPDISGLRRFALSFPYPDDTIFDKLPSKLVSLSLCDAPRYYTFLSSMGWTNKEPRKYAAPLLHFADALHIFRRISGAALLSLELVVFEDASEYDALAQIASSCPNLQTFELHRYRDVDPLSSLSGDPDVVPVVRPNSAHSASCSDNRNVTVQESIVNALSAFTALSVLRLNLSFPGIYDFGSRYRPETFDRGLAYLEQQARIVARAMPWLSRISFLGRDPGVWVWLTWTVEEDTRCLTLEHNTWKMCV